jgi:diguanylate cyclase (GGDEF)-like protein
MYVLVFEIFDKSCCVTESRAMLGQGARKFMIVGELMTEVVAGVSPRAMLSEVVRLMREKKCSCVLVSDNNYPKGIITERDVVRIFADTMLHDATVIPEFYDAPVCDVMTPEPVCVSESTLLYDALLLARTKKLRHLLVVNDQEKLVGLVTQTDMVDVHVKLMEWQLELENTNKALELLSHEDSLMKIGNRRSMEVELDFMDASTKRYGKTYAVALMDIDFFKKYNDHYGHQMGDEALQSVASAIKSSMRGTDKLFRYGGEEILLLMPETNVEQSLVAADRIRQAVQDAAIPHVESSIGIITVSVGVVAGATSQWLDLVERADKALYHAKESGRNTVCVG